MNKINENNKDIKTKSGFIALLGATNSGKSTLLNTILNKKVSIVSHKVQTTRGQIRGIKTENNIQMIFIDTPGIFNTKEKFDKAMVSSAWSAMNDSDCIIYLIDATKGITQTFNNIVSKLETITTPIALCLNKVDLIKKDQLLKLTQTIIDKTPNLFNEIFMISALKNDGLKELIKWIQDKMPISPFFYDEKQTTDSDLNTQLAEITREKIYELLHQELPYSIAVKTDKIEPTSKGTNVYQTIYTSSKTHIGIIVGENGSKLKLIGSKARKDMISVIGGKVNLFTKAKVNKNWRTSEEFYTDIGLNFKK